MWATGSWETYHLPNVIKNYLSTATIHWQKLLNINSPTHHVLLLHREFYLVWSCLSLVMIIALNYDCHSHVIYRTQYLTASLPILQVLFCLYLFFLNVSLSNNGIDTDIPFGWAVNLFLILSQGVHWSLFTEATTKKMHLIPKLRVRLEIEIQRKLSHP